MNFNEFRAHVQSCAYIDPKHFDVPRKKKAKRHKLAEKASKQLTREQQQLILDILEKKYNLIDNVALRKVSDDKYEVHGLEADSTLHTVMVSPGLITCSCPDNRFRQRECKHIKAVTKYGDTH